MRLRYSLALFGAMLVAPAVALAAINAVPGSNQLYGHITSDLTLTASSPGPEWEIIGDLTIDPGVTLTIEHGATVVVTAYSDYLASGQDRSKVEVIVRGALRLAAGSPTVRIQSTAPGGNSWSGILATDGGVVALTNGTIEDGITGLRVSAGATATLTNCTISAYSNVDVEVDGTASATLDGCEIDFGSQAATVAANGTLSVSHTVIQGVFNGIFFGLGSTGGVRGCDITGDGSNGIGLFLPFSLTPADSLHPEPTYLGRFGTGVECLTSGITLDHMIFDGCGSGVDDVHGGHFINYCTFTNNGANVSGSGANDAIYNSVLVGGTFSKKHQLDYTDWWGIDGGTWGQVTVGGQISSYDPFFAVGDPRFHLDGASFFTNFGVSGGEIGAYGPGASGPTPVHSARVIDALGSGGIAQVRWYAEAQGSSKASIVRRIADGEWRPLTVLYPDGQGNISLQDRDVQPGDRYGYGVGVMRDGRVGIEGEVWVTVDRPTSALSFASIEPNPATTEWSVDFVSPGAAESHLDVVDVGGRVVRAVNLGTIKSGRQTATISATGLAPGVYWIRVSEGGRSVLTKAVKMN